MQDAMYRRLLTGLALLATVVLGGGVGYYAIGGGRWPLADCLYMTVITVTTVGYAEVLPGMDQTPHARGFTVALLVLGTGSIVYFASTLTAFIIEGDLRNALFASRLEKRRKRMKDHVIVCGAGSTGRNILDELLKTGVAVVALDTREGPLREFAERFPKAAYTYLVADATDDEALARANLAGARGLVAALSSDKDNLYLTVSARQANPRLRIVARCAELSHVDKLRRAGADAVVSPNHIGGMRMASELLRPAVVRFLDEMLRDASALHRIEEVRLGEAFAGSGATLREARIRERFGMTVLAVRDADDVSWTYNPGPGAALAPGMTLVVLGSVEQVGRMRREVGEAGVGA